MIESRWNSFGIRACVAWIGTLAVTAAAFAQPGMQERASPRLLNGQKSYQAHCASCHGTSGHGDGPLKPYLTLAPSDLTTIAKRNGGAFPEQLMWEMIDGRSSTTIGPHGTREMPVWGDNFRAEAKYARDPHPEWSVRNRIVSLLTYLNSIQQK